MLEAAKSGQVILLSNAKRRSPLVDASLTGHRLSMPFSRRGRYVYGPLIAQMELKPIYRAHLLPITGRCDANGPQAASWTSTRNACWRIRETERCCSEKTAHSSDSNAAIREWKKNEAEETDICWYEPDRFNELINRARRESIDYPTVPATVDCAIVPINRIKALKWRKILKCCVYFFQIWDIIICS